MLCRQLLALSSLLLTLAPLAAQPLPRLTHLTPSGGQAAMAVKVTLTGPDLDDTTALLLAPAGLIAERVPDPDPKKKGQFLPNQFEIKIPADMQPGFFDVRAVCKWGVTNPRTFVVGELPEVQEKEPNNDLPIAQPLALNSTVNGAVQAANDVDYYAVACKKGQHVIVQVAAESIDSRLEPDLKVYDTTGRLLSSNRPRAEPDGVCAFTAPADGTYQVRLCAHAHIEGSPESFYRLSVSTRPWIDFVYPPVVEPGKAAHVTVWGRNLPGGKVEESFKVFGQPMQRLDVTLAPPGDPQADHKITGLTWLPPARAGMDGFFYRLRNPAGWSNPVHITYAHGPVVVEMGEHRVPEKAQVVPIPCDIVGQVQRGDQDWYAFNANAGDVIAIEGYAHRIGTPVDLYFELRRADNGSLVGEYDEHPEQTSYHRFFARTDDPVTRFAVPAKGRYELMVSSRDANLRGDPRLVYRVSLHKPKPDFRVVLVDAQPQNPCALCLRPGSRQHWDVVLFRKDGFTGPVTLTAEGLPAGVTCPPQQVPAGVSTGTLVISAADKLADFSGTITVKATTTIDGQTVTREIRSGCLIWTNSNEINNGPGFSRLCRTTALAVRQEQPPFRVSLASDKLTLPAGGTANVKLKVERLWPEAKVQIAVTALHLPLGVVFNNNQPVAVPADKNEVDVPVRVGANVPAETFPLVVRGSAPIPFTKDPKVPKAPVQMHGTSAPSTVEAYRRVAEMTFEPATASLKQGGETTTMLKIKRLHGYQGPLQVQVQGLPNGVTAAGVTVPEKATEAKLTFKAAKNAVVSTGAAVTVRVTGNVPPATLTTEAKVTVVVTKGS
jgi:hypothetical protein